MIRNLIAFWRGKSYTTEVLADFAKILAISDKMFKKTIKELFKPTFDKKLRASVYNMDQEVNELQRKIRRQIINHMAVAPSNEPNISLILMSVVKDAERLGDYTKNIFEISEMLERPVRKREFRVFFGKIFKTLETLYRHSAQAFVSFDAEKAREMIAEDQRLKRQCSAILMRLATQQDDITVNRAVCFALLAQHCKRMAAHLCNICTAVVMPLDAIDYYDEQRLEDEDEDEEIEMSELLDEGPDPNMKAVAESAGVPAIDTGESEISALLDEEDEADPEQPNDDS